MHVLIVTNYFAPEGGAAAVRLTRLAKQLAARGHEVTVLTSLPHYPQGRIQDGYRGRFALTSEVDGIRVVQTWLLATESPRIRRKLVSQISFMLTGLLRGVGLPRPDVLLVEGQPVFTGFAGALLARAKRRPYVFNVSDLWPDHLLSVGALSEEDALYRSARWLMDRIYGSAASIVAMSPGWAEIIAARLRHPVPIEVVYNGVDLELFRPDQAAATAFRQRHGLGEAKIVSFIGTLSTQYDIETIAAVARRIGRREDVQLLFIGSGSQDRALAEAFAGIEHFRWIPWLAHDEIPAAWNASFATFLAMRDHPLYRGTIPAKLYEALAVGVPVLAALEGSGARLIEDSGGGAVCACGDVRGLGDLLEAVLHQPALRTGYSRAARAYAERHLDAGRVTRAYEAALLSAVRRHR